jgi:hypothetical protein
LIDFLSSAKEGVGWARPTSVTAEAKSAARAARRLMAEKRRDLEAFPRSDIVDPS